MPTPWKRAGQLDSAWAWIKKFAEWKGLLAVLLGGVVAIIVGWVEKLPRWVIQGLVWIVTSSAFFALMTLAMFGWSRLTERIQKATLGDPLRKRVDALEKQIGQRVLTEKEKNAIREGISGRPLKVRLIAAADDSDAKQYAEQFTELFKSCGWDVWGIDLEHDFSLRGPDIGLTVLAAPKNGLNAHPAVELLVKAMTEAGMKLHYYWEFRLHPDCCELIVGHRGEPLDL